MAESIVLTANIVIPNGPQLALNRTLTLDAYDKIDVVIPDATAALTVELQPGAASQVFFLLVTSDRYGDKLTYKINGAGAALALDQPLLLTGKGAVGLLNAKPEKLVFANALGNEARVQVLIGRDATP